MNFNKHSDLEGLHAFLSPSKYHWVNYNEEKLIESIGKWQAVQRGMRLHEFAREAIDIGVKLQKIKQTLNLYVNDAIGYRMEPEQKLFYSRNCFGTADAIAFRKNLLRVHDFKSGVTPASMKQLEIYAALFCLEYGFKPKDIDIELRLYQSNEILVHEPSIGDINYNMEKIIISDKIIERTINEKGEEYY